MQPARISTAIRQSWKRILAILGVGTVLDFIKNLIAEQVRSRVMDWMVAKLGAFGYWLIVNPVAFLTVCIVSTIIWVTCMWIRELTSKPRMSVILDQNQKGFEVPRSGMAATFILFGAVLCIAVVSYGQVKYSKVRSALDTPYVNIFNDTPPQVGRGNYLTMTIYVSNATYAPALDSATVGHLYVLPDISAMSEQSAIGDFKTDLADIKAEPYGFTLGPRQRATYYIWDRRCMSNR